MCIYVPQANTYITVKIFTESLKSKSAARTNERKKLRHNEMFGLCVPEHFSIHRIISMSNDLAVYFAWVFFFVCARASLIDFQGEKSSKYELAAEQK